MRSPFLRIRRQLSSLVAAAVFSAATLRAQEAPASAPAPRLPQSNAVVLLINRLAERGTISRQDAAELIAQANADAADTRVQIAEAQLAAAKADAALARSQAALAEAKFAAGQANTAEVAATRTNSAQLAAARALLGMPPVAAAAPRSAPVADDPPVAQAQPQASAPLPAPAPVMTAPEPAPASTVSVASNDAGDLAPPSAALMAPAEALAAEARAPRAAAAQPQVDPTENAVPAAVDPQPSVTTAKPVQYADGDSVPSPSSSDPAGVASAPAQAPSSDSGATDQSGNGAAAVRVSDVLGDSKDSQGSATDGQASGSAPATRVGDALGDSTPAKPPQEEDTGTLASPDVPPASVAPAQDDGASNSTLAPASAIQTPAAPPPQQSDVAMSGTTVATGAAVADAPPEDGTVSVPYVPDVVRNQIVQEVKDEVVAEAHKEGWGTTTPEWVNRISLYGDIRVRFEDIINHSTNEPGGFVNFNAINTGSPFDIGKNATTLPPELDVDQNRQRERLRARLGAAVDLKDGFTAGFRLATGNDNNPTTENQTFGGANSAQGGDFSKYAIWLDRGYIKYQSPGDPDTSFSLTVGRFENPFLSTTMLWANDLGFDGAVLKIPFKLNGDDADADTMRPFLVAGIFPVFNTDLNFGSNRVAKFASYDKWLEAAQAGLKWKAGDFTFTSAAALYYYKNIEGQLSSPTLIETAADIGPTDDSRPSFAQNGNTYMVLRDNDAPPTVANQNNTINQFQYFGLASPFHDLVFTQKIDFMHDEPFAVSLIGEYVKNLAFNDQEVAAKAVNNLGTPTSAGGTGQFVGGNTGWLVNLKLGHLLMDKAGDWNFSVGYRRVESDSVVDAFTDADFGGVLTGTNLQGFTLGASYALTHGVWLEGHWYSASAIAGAVYKNDTVQVDLNAKF